MRLILCLVCLMMLACSTERARRESLDKAMDGWIGKPESKLLKQLGPPTRLMKLDSGETVYIYFSSSTQATSYRVPNTSYVSTNVSESSCEISYNAKGGVIISHFWKGDDCY